ncbi:MAG: glycoside hydrolase family 31 protein [Planctomycetes bacterium]|nr:glycoside hydrolase family 31 protein [Planctomycetota bacterium]
MPETFNDRYVTYFQKVSGWEKTDKGVQVNVETEQLRIDVLAPDVMRVKISRNGVFDESPTHAVCQTEFPVIEFEVKETDSSLEVTTSEMTLAVKNAPFGLFATRKDGSVILNTRCDANGSGRAYGVINDHFVTERTCLRDDAIIGLGEKTGSSNRRGRDYTLWNLDILNPSSAGEFKTASQNDPKNDPASDAFDPYYISIPFYYHMDQDTGAAGGFFIDNSYRGHYDFTQNRHYRICFDGGSYTEYIFAGPGIPEILGAYTTLTGRISAPPVWALGHHQCRWHYYNQEQVLGLANKYREKDIPCDVLWLDIDYMNGYRVFTWNDKLFPDPAALFKSLREDYKIGLITIVDPGVKHEPGYEVFDDGVKKEIFCKTEGGAIYNGQVWPGRTAFPDFSTAEGRAWWGERNAAHVASGIAGIWNDMNEPATGDISCYEMRFNHGKEPHEKYHNQYAFLMAMGTVEGLLKAMPDRRTFVLSRAGFSGIQRVAANWMGDNFSRWDHLKMSITMANGLGVSGLPFIGADVGGFAESSNPELLVRWYQCAAFTPFFRNHSCAGNKDQYPWSFGPETEKLVREAISTRYRLMPYLYSVFFESSETGAPIQRPLVYSNQYDRGAREVDDQFTLGDAILVAPVYEPYATKRPVYLPEGTWYEFGSDKTFSGGKTIHADTPPESIPVFVKGGAVIPMYEKAPESMMGYQPEVIDLHLYVPTEDGVTESTLCEDDGLTFAFNKGSFLKTVFKVERSENKLTMTASCTGAGYPEFKRTAFRLLVHGDCGENATVDGKSYPLSDIGLLLGNEGDGFSLEMELC